MDFSTEYRERSKRRVCCAKGCDSKMQNNLSLSFHLVPEKGTTVTRKNLFGVIEKINKRDEWLKKLNVIDNGKKLFVCSLHFSENDYALANEFAKKRYLKANAIPMPVTMARDKYKANLNRQKRVVQRREMALRKQKKQKQKSSTVVSKNEANINEQDTQFNIVNNEDTVPFVDVSKNHSPQAEQVYCDLDCDRVYLKSEEFIENNAEEVTESNRLINSSCEIASSCNSIRVNIKSDVNKTYEEIGVQVASGDVCITLCNFIKDEKDLMTVCGISSFKILHELVRLMDEIYPPKQKKSMSTLECIVLTTGRLKLDVSFSVLALFFKNVTDTTVRNIFYDTLKKLSSILQATIRRVSKEEIMRNMPKCFDKYRSTTSVLDCTEIKIQKPKCLKCRDKFYSHYKGDLTVKFLTEVTPAGILTYVSDSFGGRASDKCIFEHSNILNHLESTRDAIMVDKGFLVDEHCMQKQIKLIRPPFLRNQKQLSEQESIHNRSIASARVHIERMNQRIKLFQILNHKIPWYFLNHVDDIFIICCGLANLGKPILGDDKFLFVI